MKPASAATLTAIRMRNRAITLLHEDKRGSLETGKLADFVILDRDYFSVPLAEIGRIESVLTVVGGKVVYAAKP